MLKRIITHPAFIAFILLGLFLATNRYIYGWDDQALEIPLLKHLIDTELYPDDYYVASLKENFSSYLYPMLAKLISVDQIPGVYLALYLLSRYIFLLFSYKLWLHVSQNRLAALAATWMSFVIGRTEEFLYRTFSHQEFALGIIMAGLYAFYRGRYIWTAVLLGIAANFNALYALFPMIYVCVYLLCARSFRQLLMSGFAFMAAALPFLWWMIPQKLNAPAVTPGFYDGWEELFMLACPQNYLFQDRALSEVFATVGSSLTALGPYLFLIVLYVFNCLFNQSFRRDGKNHAVCLTALGLLLVSFVFSYVMPSRFFIDLNLIRNTQYMNFLLMGMTTLWIVRQLQTRPMNLPLVMSAFLMLLAFRDLTGAVVIGLTGLMVYVSPKIKSSRLMLAGQVAVLIAGAVALYFFVDINAKKWVYMLAGFLLMCLWLILSRLKSVRVNERWTALIPSGFVMIPLLIMTAYFVYLHYTFVQVTTRGGGFWQMQRNWEDMQYHVRDHTPKEARLLVPHNMEMGGFRIGSERTIVVSYRDCGIVGFDFGALKEWQRRLEDVGAFKVFPTESIQRAIVTALGKYRVDYIVFTRLNAPPSSNSTLTQIYANEVFVLFKVNR